MIGPATRCGKNATNSAKSIGLPVDFDRVAERLERVERDAGRQHHLEERRRDRQPDARQHRPDVLDEEVVVLEHPEHAEVHQQARVQVALLVGGIVLHPPPGPVVHRGGREHQDHEPWVHPPVEHVAGGEQEGVLPAVREPPVDRDDDREEDEEVDAVEDHRLSMTLRAS
jgi:hypothetical protein